MKTYIGTKLIKAEPAYREIDPHDGKISIVTHKDYPLGIKHLSSKALDGYKVVYEDGYISWSPKDVFEKAYKPVDTMTFGIALELLKSGKKVARAGWNGKKQYIELATHVSYVNTTGECINVNHEQMGNKAIAFVGTSGVQLGWLASQADMLSEDWQVIENE